MLSRSGQLIIHGAQQSQDLHKIRDLGDVDHLKAASDRIAIPRVVGTPGHDQVKAYIKESLVDLGWTVQTDRFDEKTPNMGVLTFENIMVYSNPNAENFLLIAAHYDSKYFAGQEFIGATDSAIPCAMMLNLAKTLAAPLKSQSASKVGVLLVFFDGEEAFENWSATDSIYGARHLAQRWQNEGFLKRIQLFVLLDLLGMPSPSFYSYFKETEASYASLMDAEKSLIELDLLEHNGYSGVARPKTGHYFLPHTIGMGIEDDHIPFLRRGVPILHLIPTPFPSVWHQMTDDSSCIDFGTVENLNRILRLFVVNHLQLSL